MVLPIATKWMTPEEWGQLSGHAMMSFRGDKPWLPLGSSASNSTRNTVTTCSQLCPQRCERPGPDEMEPAFNAFIADVRR